VGDEAGQPFAIETANCDYLALRRVEARGGLAQLLVVGEPRPETLGSEAEVPKDFGDEPDLSRAFLKSPY
jgi:hypothetical protein